MRIGIIGLGKLGLPLAAVLGQAYDIVGIDTNEELINKLKHWDNLYEEPQLVEYLDAAELEVYSEYKYLKHCEIIFIIVPTPSMNDGKFSSKYIEKAIEGINKHAKECKIINIVSTVMPGTCDRLQKKTSKKITYNPEFIALGNVIHGIIHPDFVMIGSQWPWAIEKLKKIYDRIISPVPIIQTMELKEAEIAKIALNSYVTMKISFANVIGEIAEKYKVNPDHITRAIGCDKRIGHMFFKAGSAYGGPCFPRDNRAFKMIAKDIPNYAGKTDEINKYQTDRLVKKLKKYKYITIWGMSYKNGTSITEESAGSKLKEELEKYVGKKITEDEIKDETEAIVFMLPKTDQSIFAKWQAGMKKQFPNIKEIIDLWRDK